MIPRARRGLFGRMTSDDHPRARVGSSKGAARPPPEPNSPIVCDVGALGHADVRSVEALALLQVAARRRGFHIVIRDASEDLRDLIVATGPWARGVWDTMVPLDEEAKRRTMAGLRDA